ncbi:MAG: hypothetical protein KJZ64_02770 [Sphingomonadaceae bacterium]|nr:hypothetical protein [Sphingomonadaceae bacterium]
MYDSYDPEMELMELEAGDSMFGAYQEGAFETGGGLGGYEAMFEDEFESFGEFENDGYFEFESDLGELEGDPFFGKIWNGVKKVAKAVAPLAKKFAPQIGTVIGGALGGPAGAAIGGKLGGVVKALEGEGESESESEMEAQYEGDGMDEAIAESMATAGSKGDAATAQTMGSALTVTIASRAPAQVRQVLPVLAKAGGDVARTLARSNDPRAKMLVRALPTIQKRTVATLTAKARAGKPVTPRTAARVMTKHAVRTLNSPQDLAKALANNAVKKNKLDRTAIARAERFY